MPVPIEWSVIASELRQCMLQLGADWRSVVRLCSVARYQPLLLLYANSNTELIDVSSAPDSVSHVSEQLPAYLQGKNHIFIYLFYW